MSGCALLWHVYQRFKLDVGAAVAIDYHTLVGLRFNGDLLGFLANYDSTIIFMAAGDPGPQLRKCKVLLRVFVNIDGFPGDSELRGLRYFYDVANREVTRKQCENT